MSTRHIRTIKDFARHRRDVELVCYCGHRAVLPFAPVVAAFVRHGWPIALGLAAGRFRCTKCGSAPRQLGPMDR